MHQPDTSLARTRLLIVEDEPVCRDVVQTFLTSAGATVTAVSSAETALDQLATDSFDAVITDIRLEEMDGIELLKRIRAQGADLPVIIMTGFASMQSAISALKLGADDYLTKPIRSPESIVRATRNAIDRLHLRTQNAMLRGQLAESERSLQTVFDHTADMIFSFTVNSDSTLSSLEEVNTAATSTLAYPESTLRKMSMLDVVAPTHRKNALAHLSTLDKQVPCTFDTVLISADGKLIPADMSCHILKSEARHLIIVIARNMSDRVEIEARFANRMEDERARMGRELHDVVCQDLAAIDILVKTASLSPSSGDMLSIGSAAASALAAARQLSRGLVPSFADTSEFLMAVEDLLRTHKNRHNIDFVLNIDHPVAVPYENGLLHLFRIIQESVSNAVKHSDATAISVADTTLDGIHTITVTDDGKGSNAKEGLGGMGLLIMNQRARIIGASVSVSPHENGGTRMECSWQIPKEQHA